MTFGDENIIFGTSLKKDGNMRFSKGSNNEIPSKNRSKFFENLNLDYNKSIKIELSHGNEVRIVKANHVGQVLSSTDGLITNVEDIILTLTVADCMPICIYDQSKKVIGLLHVGWRGLFNGIINNAVNILKNNFKSLEKDLAVMIGPHIHVTNYEVGEDVANSFSNYINAVIIKDGSYFLDLSFVAKKQFLDLEVPENNIEISREDTYELNNKYFSYRRDKPQEIEAILAYIKLKNVK